MWHITRDMWHVTHGTWHMICDTWQLGGGEPSLKISAPYALTVWEWRCADITKVFGRTAPATMGLLKRLTDRERKQKLWKVVTPHWFIPNPKQLWNHMIGLIRVKEEGRAGFSEGWQACSEGFQSTCLFLQIVSQFASFSEFTVNLPLSSNVLDNYKEILTSLNRELKQYITSLTITSPSLHHHFLCLFIFLRFLAGLVLLSTEFTQPTLN